ncbi:alpha/beta fold hydrolase [Arenivirga flava]|uniref:AB hydrolase-1 domain-containing protein n=1 Tax=Arenivirga flava TaxID=1930060 RepID=A0AA37XAD0_9MICO|nr:alpha/beta fold hydrolase [Arenivirga flava]GMA27225.1 hypothetical protein GCM10025874_04780 [Arenivirga flava]
MIRVHPGFPLTHEDYLPLLERMQGWPVAAIAHSLGALDALGEPIDGTTILLAPSVPRRRSGRPALRALLLAAHRSPWSTALAERLRIATFHRYGASAPLGSALPLDSAASRLRTPHRIGRPQGPLLVVCAEGDPRRPTQERFAAELGAEVLQAPGGHLFPVTHPAETAAALAAALLR